MNNCVKALCVQCTYCPLIVVKFLKFSFIKFGNYPISVMGCLYNTKSFKKFKDFHSKTFLKFCYFKKFYNIKYILTP